MTYTLAYVISWNCRIKKQTTVKCNSESDIFQATRQAQLIVQLPNGCFQRYRTLPADYHSPGTQYLKVHPAILPSSEQRHVLH